MLECIYYFAKSETSSEVVTFNEGLTLISKVEGRFWVRLNTDFGISWEQLGFNKAGVIYLDFDKMKDYAEKNRKLQKIANDVRDAVDHVRFKLAMLSNSKIYE